MTNDEAIKYLEYLKDNYTRKGGLMCQAVDTAIEALKPKVIHTNGDRIRNMTDEELAELFDEIDVSCNKCKKHHAECDMECYEGYLLWLKQDEIEV